MFIDMILTRYFRPKEYYAGKLQEALWQKEQLLAAAYSHTSYDEIGLKVVKLPVEEYAIRSEAIENRISKFGETIARDKKTLDKAMKKISRRQRILLFVYYQTGVILTTYKELHRAKEHLLEALDLIKDKHSERLKLDYLKKVQGEGGFNIGQPSIGRTIALISGH